MGKHPWGCWSPDGTQISCLSLKGIEILDVATGKVKRRMKRAGYFQQLFWSPDGKWIAYETRVNGQFDIWLIDPEGNVNFPLVEHPRSDEGPTWSPDGRRIAFSSTRRGRADIYTVDRSGGSLERLTRGIGDNTHPSWSPYPR